MTDNRLTSNEIEAANRAEATAILIRAGYRVYRPEADVSGEDLVIRAPDGELRAVQMKGRPSVDWRRYGGRQLWMLFPDPAGRKPGRPWFFIKHDTAGEFTKSMFCVGKDNVKSRYPRPSTNSPAVSNMMTFLLGLKIVMEQHRAGAMDGAIRA
jgi:hypothetical protein